MRTRNGNCGLCGENIHKNCIQDCTNGKSIEERNKEYEEELKAVSTEIDKWFTKDEREKMLKEDIRLEKMALNRFKKNGGI
mgnify:CR=1 FL=1